MDILILEDDLPLLLAFAQALESDNHNVHAVSDIETAADIVSSCKLDILLLDLMIGNDSSLQIAELAGYAAPDAEVVYVTGSTKFANGELFQMYQNTSWVMRKPVDFRDLKALINYLGKSPSGKRGGAATQMLSAKAQA
ncbi:response regulator [uncultured Roseobacter sp.]|uniref:response regulator n=1 Tax=uncultured Roseobacter sp. TaxID=114847 RepID=UPI00263492F6|nr:response regulator [uncultured Roseobacter sp.]